MATGAVMPAKMKANTVPVVMAASCTRIWLPGPTAVKHRPQAGRRDHACGPRDDGQRAAGRAGAAAWASQALNGLVIEEAARRTGSWHGTGAYQARLVGHTIGEIFGRAATFLTLTGATAASNAGQQPLSDLVVSRAAPRASQAPP